MHDVAFPACPLNIWVAQLPPPTASQRGWAGGAANHQASSISWTQWQWCCWWGGSRLWTSSSSPSPSSSSTRPRIVPVAARNAGDDPHNAKLKERIQASRDVDHQTLNCWLVRGWWQIPETKIPHVYETVVPWYRLQRLPFTYWVALLQEHINQLDDLEGAKALLHLFAGRTILRGGTDLQYVEQAHYITISWPRAFLYLSQVAHEGGANEHLLRPVSLLLTCKPSQTRAWITVLWKCGGRRHDQYTPSVSLTCQSFRRQNSAITACRFLVFGSTENLVKATDVPHPEWYTSKSE